MPTHHDSSSKEFRIRSPSEVTFSQISYRAHFWSTDLMTQKEGNSCQMAFIFPTHLLSVSEVRGFRKSLHASGAYQWWQQEISSSRKESKSLPFGKEGLGSPSVQPYLSGIFLLPRRPASTCRPLGLGVEKEGTERATERGSKGFRCELC